MNDKTEKMLQKAMKNGAKNNKPELIRYGLEQGADPSFEDNFSFIMAANSGYLDIVKILINDPRVNPKDSNNLGMQFAIRGGKYDVVEFLVNTVYKDMSDNQRMGFKFIAKEFSDEMVSLFI